MPYMQGPYGLLKAQLKLFFDGWHGTETIGLKLPSSYLFVFFCLSPGLIKVINDGKLYC